MGTGASSESTGYDEVRDRINSADFQKISPPSSPSIMTKQDEMSYSGILVEKPGSETESRENAGASAVAVVASSSVPSSEGATFAADLTTPPVSNRSKSRIHKTNKGGDSLQPRRIIKATPPPSKTVLEETETKETAVDSPAVPHHTTFASPIGANATNDLLEESIAKNASKSKRLEKVSNRQKNDREKLLQEKRRMRGNGTEAASEKPQVEANPFSRFLSAFRVDANSKHKRKESNADKFESDPADTKRVKYGFSGTGAVSTTTGAAKDYPDKDEAEDTDAAESTPSSFSWIAAASAATLVMLIFSMIKRKKRN